MTSYTDELRALLASAPKPVCLALTPFELLEADAEQGRARVEFAAQPPFGNHFGNIQGGFAVAMLEVPLTIAVFIKTKRFLPTIEILRLLLDDDERRAHFARAFQRSHAPI